jgi:hypothetical protein
MNHVERDALHRQVRRKRRSRARVRTGLSHGVGRAGGVPESIGE